MLFDLSPDVDLEGAIGRVDHRGSVDAVDRPHDLLPVVGAVGVDGDVPDQPPVGFDQVDRANYCAGLADSAGDLAEHARHVFDLDPDGEAVLR